MGDLQFYEKIPAIENNFTVKFRVYSRTKKLIPHWHEHIEMLYMTDGECEFICNGKPLLVKEGDLVVVNSTEVHSFTAKRMTEYYSILLYPQFFADIRPIDKLICNHVRGDGTVRRFFTDLHLEYANGEVGSDMAIKGILYTLLTYLYRNYPYGGEGEKSGLMTAEVLDRLGRVITYISEHYAEKITTAALAEMCYISEAHFCRFFKNAVGKTVMKYINEYRVEKATVLLANTGGSVAEIAAEVGFEDPNYFSRVFRSVMGISPAEYRASLL